MSENTFSKVLAFEDRFPVSEKRMEASFSQDKIHDLNSTAKEVLNAIITIEQLGYEQTNSDSNSNASELFRLEQKVDFVTELLASLLLEKQKRPEIKSLKMSARHLCWQPDISLKKNEFCTVSIYLSQKYPAALELPVVIINSNLENSSDPETEAKILLTDENVMDDLTRMIFLYHRKQIARNRTQS
ncbi:MAG: PilZ domain-containing protein [Gammaproteobacteria bacterium]